MFNPEKGSNTESMDANQNVDFEQSVAEAKEQAGGDMTFDEAMDYLETKYANYQKTEDGQGDLALYDNISRARNGEPDAYDGILRFIEQQKASLTVDQDDPEEMHKLSGLEKARVAIEVQKQRDVENADREREQQLAIQKTNETVAKDSQAKADKARDEIYTSVYPPNKSDFDNEAIKLAGRYGANWQTLTGAINFNVLAEKEPAKATAAFLMIKNAYEHNAPYELFKKDWDNLMRKATDNNHDLPRSDAAGTESNLVEAKAA